MRIKVYQVILFLPVMMMWLTAMQIDQKRFVNKRSKPASGHYLYVAVPGIRDYMGYGGHGVLVFDMDHGHQFVKRIETRGFHPNKKPSNVKGIAVSIPLNSVYISTIESLQRIDLTTGKIIWEKTIDGGCDRMSISPDGKTMYLPYFEGKFWNVVDCKTGEVIKKIPGFTRSHNTVYGLSGDHVYLDDIASPWLKIADTKTHTIVNKVGPFGNFIRPFTINGKETRAYVTIDSLFGFEVGDIKTGKKLARVEVEGWTTGAVRRHGDPSHGIGLTPDEKELWLCDGYNMRLHVFSAVEPYQQLTTIPLQDMPGWVTFSLDGKYAYPSSGEVIDVKTRKILLTLKDEFNNSVASEKMVEVDFENGKAVRAGDQFGLGRVTK
jgi:DNA-binding beta-propeller fold protein YncE